MARWRLRARYLSVLRTDALAESASDVWLTRCLHCRTALQLSLNGAPLSAVTLEHIVPQSWFSKWPNAACCRAMDGADDPRNLALACARCNHDKGKDLDVRGPRDPRALNVVLALLARRAARWRDVSEV
jgi:5-methylcytosine-specific restriction endonuclease McrA